MDAHCRIELFGGLRVVQADRVITRFGTQKTAALLAYLAYRLHSAHPREVLIELLWPDCLPEAGRNRLRVALTSLRHQLEPAGVPPGTILIIDRALLQLSPAIVTTDVLEFEEALRLAAQQKSPDAKIEHLTRAVELYQGELLSGFYEDWMLTEQRRMAVLSFQAIRRLTAYLKSRGDLERAMAYASQAVRTDPLCEEAHVQLVALYAAAGQPRAAWDQYREMEQILRRELDQPPSETARSLMEQVLESAPSLTKIHTEDQGQRQPQQPGAKKTKYGRSADRAPVAEVAAPRLPLQYTRFFGREDELAQLVTFLSHPLSANSSLPRLVTLTGPGGSGKTRLALEAARRLLSAYGEAVWYLPLVDLANADLIAGALLDLMKLPRTPNTEPIEQVVRALSSRPTLLVLDNFEHLFGSSWSKPTDTQNDGTQVVRALLERVPQLTLLITSRRVLGLRGECEFPVPPLPTPEDAGAQTPEHLMTYGSVQLFINRAQMARPDFQVTNHNVAAVAQLCQCLEGIPLAIELAAARSHVLTPTQMLGRMAHRFDFLVGHKRDTAERHRSLHAAIEWSYRLLAPDLQRFFRRLSMFRGGWTLESAEAVCEEPLALDYLEYLKECSLIRNEEFEGAIRFRLLETLREFGDQRMEPQERQTSAERHLTFFVKWTAVGRSNLWNAQQAAWCRLFDLEHNNIRAALEWSRHGGALDLERGNGVRAAGLQLACHTWRFWFIRGHWAEGQRWLEEMLSLNEDAPADLRALATDVAAKLAARHGDTASARRLFQTAYSMAYETGTLAQAWSGLDNFGAFLAEQGEYAEALPILEESLRLARAAHEIRGIACALRDLGELCTLQGNIAAAQAYTEEGLLVSEEYGDGMCIADTLTVMGMLARIEGDYVRSRAHYERGLSLRRTLDDRHGIAALLEGFAGLAAAQEAPRHAIHLYAAAEALRETIGAPILPAYRDDRDAGIKAARTQLDESTFEAVWIEGHAMTWDQAIAYALEDAVSP